jgi:hypothetical protein
VTRLANKEVDEKGDKLKQGVGRCMLASSQGYEEAYDRMEKDHSIFTYYLLEALNGHEDAVNDEGNVTYDSVGRFISREIGRLPPERRPNQTPIRKGEVSGGDIILAHYTKQPVETKLIEMASAADPAITKALESPASNRYAPSVEASLPSHPSHILVFTVMLVCLTYAFVNEVTKEGVCLFNRKPNLVLLSCSQTGHFIQTKS